MAKFPLQIKVFLLLLVTVTMVVAAGYLTWINLSSIVSTLKSESNPDFRLLSLKDLSADLNDADNSVRLYVVTEDSEYLQPYQLLEENYERRMTELYGYYRDMPYQQSIIDSIKILIPAQLEVWDQMIKMKDTSRVATAIGELTTKYLSEAEDTTQIIIDKKDGVHDKNVELVYKDENVSDNNDNERVAKKDVNEKETGFFRRIFQRKKSEIVQPEISVLPPLKDTIHKVPEPILIDSLAIDLKQELSKLEELRKLDSLAAFKSKVKESALLERNKELFSRLNQLIGQIEEDENLAMAGEARRADQLATATFQWLIIFSLSISFLLIILFFVIINYVRKTRATQRAMSAAREQAENLSKTKEMFIANVSHEMRTPMNAIYGLSDQLLMRSDLKPDLHEQIEIISKSANHLLSVINEILDFSKIQSGKIQLENIDFSPVAVCNEVIQLNRFLAKEKDIALTSAIDNSVPDVLLGDPVRLKQVLLNLVSNAIKFTDFGEVRLVVNSLKKKAGNVELVINIEDTGIGIEEERIEYLFEDFTQEDSSTSRKYGGTGLGLAIAKKLVLLMGGQISVESKKNIGTIFNVKLPFAKGDVKNLLNEETVQNVPALNYEGLRALIVDDEEYNRLVLRLILKKWKVDFEEAENGEIALLKLKNQNFDVVLMDIRMPVMDGISATEQIRKDSSFPAGMKIIGLSATNAKEDVQASIAAGMDSFLLKPFNEKSLRKTFEYLIKSSPARVLNKETATKETATKEATTKEITDRRDDNENKFIPTDSTSLSGDRPDFESLYRLGSGDKTFVIELLEVFVRNTQKSLEEMEDCLRSKNYRCIADIAHRTSSSCMHLKALTLYGLLREIEEAARGRKETERLPELIEEATVVRKRFVNFIQEHIDLHKKR